MIQQAINGNIYASEPNNERQALTETYMVNKATAGWAWLGCSWDEDPRREKRIRDTRDQKTDIRRLIKWG